LYIYKFLDFLEPNSIDEKKEENNSNFKIKYKKNYFALPINSNYVIESFRVPCFSHDDLSKLRVFGNFFFIIQKNNLTIAEMMDAELNREVVDQGGAYAGGCIITSNGTLSCYSFKDPHTIQTYELFEKSASKIANGVFRYFLFFF